MEVNTVIGREEVEEVLRAHLLKTYGMEAKSFDWDSQSISVNATMGGKPTRQRSRTKNETVMYFHSLLLKRFSVSSRFTTVEAMDFTQETQIQTVKLINNLKRLGLVTKVTPEPDHKATWQVLREPMQMSEDK